MFGFFAFVPPNMLLEVIKFGNQKIVSPFNLCAHLNLIKCIFPLKPKTTSAHVSFATYCPHSLNLFFFSFSIEIVSKTLGLDSTTT
jgi:hypothetical protein